MIFPLPIRWVVIAPALLASACAVFAEGPFLLNAQQATMATRPEYVRDHSAHIDTLPFDGMVISSEAGRTIMDGTARSEAEMAREFTPLNRLVFSRMKRNFALVNVDRPADFFGDWSVTIENFRSIARVLRSLGLAGIFLDNEEYARSLFNYPEDCSEPARSLTEYQAQARLRGRQIMEAVAGEFPGVVLIAAHGPYSSFAGTPADVRGKQTAWDSEELRGAFSVGLVEGMDSRSRFIDGGELYVYRTAAEFQASYDFRKNILAAPATNCAFIPDYLRGIWARKVGIGYGLYNCSYQQRSMNPLILRSTLEEAMRRSDGYVWLYFEGENWNAPASIAPEWIEAVIGARAAVSPSILPSDPPPWVGISGPLDGAIFNAPAAVTIVVDAVDADGSVAKVEFFSDGTKLGEDTSRPYTLAWQHPPIGSHRLSALATDSAGASCGSSPVQVTISANFRAAINFQPADLTAPPGYRADIGEIYGNRGDGLQYGWNTNHAEGMRLRSQGQELRRATLCQVRAGGVWEIGVQPGSYGVTVGIGDPDYPSVHTINVEGVNYWSRLPLESGKFAEMTRIVSVTDGRISIDQGQGGFEETRIAYVLVAAAGAVPSAPSGLTARRVAVNAIDLTWADNSSTESSFELERSTDPGFIGEIAVKTVLPGVVLRSDQGLVPGSRYFYRLRATNAAGNSTWSNVASAALPPLDLDEDGLPDILEIHPCRAGVDDRAADADGDGFLNATEASAGTDALWGGSYPRLTLDAASAPDGSKSVALGFPTLVDRIYVAEFTDAPEAGVWTMCDGFPIEGDGAWRWELDATTVQSRFYRLRIQPLGDDRRR